jgi:hypothetical protein
MAESVMAAAPASTRRSRRMSDTVNGSADSTPRYLLGSIPSASSSAKSLHSSAARKVQKSEIDATSAARAMRRLRNGCATSRMMPWT